MNIGYSPGAVRRKAGGALPEMPDTDGGMRGVSRPPNQTGGSLRGVFDRREKRGRFPDAPK